MSGTWLGDVAVAARPGEPAGAICARGTGSGKRGQSAQEEVKRANLAFAIVCCPWQYSLLSMKKLLLRESLIGKPANKSLSISTIDRHYDNSLAFTWTPGIPWIFLVSLLLSFQKVCRIHFYSWMSEHDVTFYSQTLILLPRPLQVLFLLEIVWNSLKQSIQTIINLSD